MKKIIKHKILRRLVVTLFISVTVALFLFVGSVFWQVQFGDTTALEKKAILSKIKEETTLYYLDETTRMGSIFKSEHRRYVLIQEIPVQVLNAVVAAEDKNFYRHAGVDIIAIGKAFLDGILRGGRFRRGGSTITQQTVKNIVNDWESSISRKYRELVRALQLETLYTKEEILEFYLNRFHVVGNGNGIGIAARYYFNKEVRDLSLVEAAFIAGSLKGPGKYNPFIKFSVEKKEQAIEFANQRKNYVLRRMREQGWISKIEYLESLEEVVPFNRGEFRTSEVALIELIKHEVNRKEILDAINVKNIEELSFSGLKIFTTLDVKLQKEAQFSMRKNLSRIETILQGFQVESKEKYKKLRTIKPNSFIYAKVDRIFGDRFNNYEIELSAGHIKGLLSNQALRRYAKLLNLSTSKGVAYHIDDMIHRIKKGDILYLQVLTFDKKNNVATFELQKKPDVNGGLIVLDKGEVRSIISGFETFGFNRALHAKRQPGSVMKSLLFFAGLQLGWSTLDRLNNERRVFYHQGELYIPKPDHAISYKNPSMLWTAIMSENIASVQMAYRLLEKLNFKQFKELLRLLDSYPYKGEKASDFHKRIGSLSGVSLDTEGIKEYQLVQTIDNMIPDLVFSQNDQLISSLKQMWWGQDYLSGMEEVRRNEYGKLTKKEGQLRLGLLENNYLRFQKLYKQLVDDWGTIKFALQYKDKDSFFSDKVLEPILSKFRVIEKKGKSEISYYSRPLEEIEEIVFSEELVDDYFSEGVFDPELLQKNIEKKKSRTIDFPKSHGIKLSLEELEKLVERSDSKEDLSIGEAVLSNFETIKLNGTLPVSVYKNLQVEVEERFDLIKSKKDDKYRLYTLYQHQEFRVALGLRYLVKLAEECGVSSKIKPVLSLALGSSELSVSDVAKIYQTFIEGKRYRFYEDDAKNQLTFIRRIEDRFGNVLFTPKKTEHQLVKRELTFEMQEILRKVITNGTGRRAKGELFVSNKPLKHNNKLFQKEIKISVPVYGKTGTNNNFTTSYFAGWLPYPIFDKTIKDQSLDVSNSYVIAAYIGYDNNKSMRNGRQRIYGGAGALPLWTDFSKRVLEVKEYANWIDFLDLSVLSKREWPIKRSDQISPYMVDLARGVILKEGDDADAEMFKPTDIAKTGEKFQNLFTTNHRKKAVMFLPNINLSNDLEGNREAAFFKR